MVIGLIIIIIISTILTGNPIAKNDNLINILTGILGIYVIVKALKNKEKIIGNKGTILVFILCVSSIVPLIFNSYVSLNGTMYYIFRYISIFIIYVSTSMAVSENEKNKEYIIKTIIFSGVILVLFGIDLLSTNITKDIVKILIGTLQDQQAYTRMYSVFLYSNTFAIAATVSYILSIEQVLKKVSKIYSGISFVLLSGIILSQSRTSLLILGFMLILYIALLKNKEERYKIVKLIFTNVIVSGIYVVIFVYAKRVGLVWYIWLLIPTLSLISSVLFEKMDKNEKINKFIKIRYLFIFLVIVLVIFFILTCFKSELVLFKGNNAQIEIAKNIFDVKGGEEYNLSLEVESKSDTKEDNYLIEFIQRNKYADDVGRKEFKINNYSGTLNFDMKLANDIEWIEFSITANKTDEQTEMRVKALKINGKDFVLNYKYLPTDLINQIKYINLSQRSVWERFVLIGDGIKIIKSNLLFGIGGDGWKYKSPEVQSYFYSIAEMHSYPIQLWMEFGLVGILAYMAIIFIVLKKSIIMIKNKKTENLSIILAFLALFIHSLIDFDLTFLYMLFVFYILIAIILNEKSHEEKRKTISAVLSIIFIIVFSISIYFNCCEIYVKSTKNNDLRNTRTYEEKTKLEKKYIYLVPYNEKYVTERAEYLELYMSVKKDELSEEQIESMKEETVELLKKSINQEKNNTENLKKCLKIIKYTEKDEDRDFAYKKIEDIFIKHRYNANQILKDYEDIYIILREDSRLKEIVNRNQNKDIDSIRDIKKSRITKERAEEIIQIIQENRDGKRFN